MSIDLFKFLFIWRFGAGVILRGSGFCRRVGLNVKGYRLFVSGGFFLSK